MRTFTILFRSLCLTSLCLLSLSPAYSADSTQADTATFDKLFSEWAQSFNRKDLAGSCKLFSKDCMSSSPGADNRDYDAIRNSFDKLFASTNKTFKYTYKLRNVNRSGDLATARITWYLDAYQNKKLVAQNEEQGLDVFRLKNGTWKIVNFIAYSEKRR